MVFHFLQDITHRSGEIIASIAAVFVAFSQPSIEVINPPPLLVLPVPTSTESVLKAEVASTTPTTTVATAPKEKTAPKTASSSPSSPTPAAAQITKPKRTNAAPKIATVRSILDGTSFSLNRRTDGMYWVSLRTNTGTDSFNWGFTDTAIGGTAYVPAMNVSFQCDPQWIAPSINSPDQNPLFAINTSYACKISLTDAILRAAEKTINFKTGTGRLVIKSSSLSTTLLNGVDSNGFVFENQNDSPINVGSIFFDVSFKLLNISSPIVLRFTNPDNDSSFVDFQVQDLPADPVKAGFRTGTGMKVELPFTVSPGKQRLFKVEILGVQTLSEIGTKPEFNVTLRQINIATPNVTTLILSPAISWSCIPYDPIYSNGNLPNEQNCR